MGYAPSSGLSVPRPSNRMISSYSWRDACATAPPYAVFNSGIIPLAEREA